MRNPIVAVLRIYYARATSSWRASTFTLIAGVLLGCALAGSIITAINPNANHGRAISSIWVMTTIGLGYLSFVLWMQFRDLIVGESGRLWPAYRAPNVVVFAWLSTILFGVVPGAMSVLTNMNSPGLLVLAMVLFAANGWRMATRSVVVQVACIGVLTSAWFAVFESSDNIAFNPSYPVALAVILVSIATAVAACVKMSRLTDDDPSFRSRRPWIPDIVRPRMTGDLNRVWSDAQRTKLFAWPGRGHQAYIPQSDGLWQGARRWRSLNSGFVVLMVHVAAMMTAIGIAQRIWLLRDQSKWHALVLKYPHLVATRGPMNPQIGSVPLAIWLAIFPISFVAQTWIAQWRFLELESLRPIARDRFIQQVGIAIGIQMFQAWFVFASALILEAIVVDSQPVDVNGMMTLVAGSLGVLVFGYGLVVWSLRYRASATAAVILCSGATAALMGIMIFGINTVTPISAYIGILPVLLLASGLYLARTAYRRWLVADLG
jgi:hypothetical protein